MKIASPSRWRASHSTSSLSRSLPRHAAAAPTTTEAAATVNTGRGKTLSLAEALRLEFGLASRIVELPDYAAGITARIMGKGAEPRWQPATLSEVDDAEIERLFATAPERELQLEERQ